MLQVFPISQASKCIILSFFCKFGYQNETFRNYYLALKTQKCLEAKVLGSQIRKIGLHFGKTFLRSKHFLESLQISHNFKGNFNQNNINKKNFNQKLMFFDFIYILTLLLEYRVTDLSGSEREEFLWWTATVWTLKKNQHDTAFWWRHHSIVHSFKYTKNDPEKWKKSPKVEIL